MKSKANYTYEVGNELVRITDLNLGNKSVTNDAENVINEIQSVENIKGKQILYKDSEGNWEEIIPTWRENYCINVFFKSLYI